MAQTSAQRWNIRPQARLATILGLLSCIALTGCGPSTDRLEVTGEVTFDGGPLDSGSIRFTSLGEIPIASGAMIENGQYHISKEKGLPPGTYHVSITSPDTEAPPVMAGAIPGEPGIPVAPERIPPEYNVKSKHSVEVTPDGDNHFVFDIVRRPT